MIHADRAVWMAFVMKRVRAKKKKKKTPPFEMSFAVCTCQGGTKSEVSSHKLLQKRCRKWRRIRKENGKKKQGKSWKIKE